MAAEASQPTGEPAHPAHDAHACLHCMVSPSKPGSARVAWAVAAVAVALLMGVLMLGASSQGGFALSLAALPLVAVLACPLTMGAMMWLMMRKH